MELKSNLTGLTVQAEQVDEDLFVVKHSEFVRIVQENIERFQFSEPEVTVTSPAPNFSVMVTGTCTDTKTGYKVFKVGEANPSNTTCKDKESQTIMRNYPINQALVRWYDACIRELNGWTKKVYSEMEIPGITETSEMAPSQTTQAIPETAPSELPEETIPFLSEEETTAGNGTPLSQVAKEIAENAEEMAKKAEGENGKNGEALEAKSVIESDYDEIMEEEVDPEIAALMQAVNEAMDAKNVAVDDATETEVPNKEAEVVELSGVNIETNVESSETVAEATIKPDEEQSTEVVAEESTVHIEVQNTESMASESNNTIENTIKSEDLVFSDDEIMVVSGLEGKKFGEIKDSATFKTLVQMMGNEQIRKAVLDANASDEKQTLQYKKIIELVTAA